MKQIDFTLTTDDFFKKYGCSPVFLDLKESFGCRIEQNTDYLKMACVVTEVKNIQGYYIQEIRDGERCNTGVFITAFSR